MSKRGDRITKLTVVIDEIIEDWPASVQTTVYGVRTLVESLFREHSEYAWLKEGFNLRGLDTLVTARMIMAGYKKVPWGWLKPKEVPNAH